MGILTLGLIFCVVFGVVFGQRHLYPTPVYNPQPDICQPGPKGRVPWILHVRDSDYGWKEHTHRANIALAVNRYRGPDEDMRKMGLQLEVELTRALIGNATSRIHDNDLALYIHALLAANKNPRNFHGVDLVADLLHRVDSTPENVHPFLVLALCNSYVVSYDHLLKIESILTRTHADTNHPDVDSGEVQLKAIAYKAFACAATIKPSFNKFSVEMEQAANCLLRKYNETDGTFGNVYTTSLAVQAFTASKRGVNNWNERKSLEYLEKESEIDVNLIKAYYIEMALNARQVKFIKDLYTGPIPLPGPRDSLEPEGHYIQYTIKNERSPETFFSITMKVPETTNFYSIMEKCAQLSDTFNFSSYENRDGLPMIYAVSGIPNDAEENMFWRLCRQYSVDHVSHVSEVDTLHESPISFVPKTGDHIIFWYLNSDCPKIEKVSPAQLEFDTVLLPTAV